MERFTILKPSQNLTIRPDNFAAAFVYTKVMSCLMALCMRIVSGVLLEIICQFYLSDMLEIHLAASSK